MGDKQNLAETVENLAQMKGNLAEIAKNLAQMKPNLAETGINLAESINSSRLGVNSSHTFRFRTFCLH